MARINNLSNFLTDVATAIKNKKGSETPIPAANFDTEITNLPSQGVYQHKTATIAENGTITILPDAGYDAIDQLDVTVTIPLQQKTYTFTQNTTTTITPEQGYAGFSQVNLEIDVQGGTPEPTTATVNDVISPKTFYSNGQKLTGLLVPTYLDLGRVKFERTLNAGQYIQDINLEYKFCLVCNHGANNPVISIYRLTDEYQLGNLVTSYTVQGAYKSFLFNAQVSRILDSNNKFVVWIASRNNGLNWTYNAFELDPNTLEISNAKYKDTYTSWGSYHNSNITINPTNPNEAFIAFPSGSKSDTRLMRAVYNSATGITESNLGQCYSYIDTYCEWDLSGNYILTTNNFGGSAGYVLCSRTSRLKESNSTVPKCLVNGVYGFAGNTYFNFQTATVLYTYTDNTILSQSGHIWCSNDRLYKYYNNKIYIYAMDLSTTYPTLTLLSTVNVNGYTGNAYMGTVNAPVNGSEHAYVSSQVNAILWPLSTTQFLKTLRDVNNQMLYNTSDSSGISSEVLQGRTLYGTDGKITGTMPNNGTLNYTPATSPQSIPAGYTSGGTISAVTSAIDSNIRAENIKAGVTILGVTGTYTGETNN